MATAPVSPLDGQPGPRDLDPATERRRGPPGGPVDPVLGPQVGQHQRAGACRRRQLPGLFRGQVSACFPRLVARRDGAFSYLPVNPGVLVGGVANASFTSATIQLQPGDLLFLYTDGVTEAMNERDELFGDKRMFDAINAVAPRHARGVITGMRSAVNAHVHGTPASDDVTMLALGLKP